MDQIGPQSKDGRLTHGTSESGAIVTLHDCQILMHGPVLYTEDVFEFLHAQEDQKLKHIYPLFVKDVRYRDQREYRFVAVGNAEEETRFIDLQMSGMMRDALVPAGRSSDIQIASTKGEPLEGNPDVRTPRQYVQTQDRTRRQWEKHTRTVTVGGEVRQTEVTTRELVVSLTSKSVVERDRVPDQEDLDQRRRVQVSERRSHDAEVDGVSVEAARQEITRVGCLDEKSDADQMFGEDGKSEARDVLAVAGRIGARIVASQELRNAVARLFGAALSPDVEKSVEIASAAWHSLCALANLHEHWGDVVETIVVEQGRYIAISLKPSPESDADGKLLVGPLGTYAYVLRKNDELTFGCGGEDGRLVLFPDQDAVEKFSEFGWELRTTSNEGE